MPNALNEAHWPEDRMTALPDNPALVLRSALIHKLPDDARDQFELYPWQVRLLDLMCNGELPRALDLPTGLGKTSVLSIWLVARMYAPNRLPRRLVYIVDRRAVVDQASEVAASLRDWSKAEPYNAALGLTGPLPVSTLRGQLLDRKEWLADPASPAIIVGTVDMIGSRLLFGGYGVSRKMRPYHAGFLGWDTLFVLDESHLVPPFERLLEGVQAPELWPEHACGPGRPMRLLSLSATGGFSGETFRLSAEDMAHDKVIKRTGATKRLHVHPIDAKANLAQVLAEQAFALSTTDMPSRVVVFSSSRQVAENARDHLLKLFKERTDNAAPPHTELLVGARRLRERMTAGDRIRAMGFLSGTDRVAQPCFLFATSAGEVGVDLDADHAVMDVVAWERMVQRLGRINRAGEGAATVMIVAQDEAKWLPEVRALLDLLPIGDDNSRDGSPQALAQLAEAHPQAVANATTPEPLHPAVTLPVVQAWAMTSLREHTGRPEVEPWLRGWVDVEPQTAVAWRSLLPAEPDLAPYLDAFPVTTSERLEMSTPLVVKWLLDRASKARAELLPDDRAADARVVALRTNRAQELESTYTLGELANATTRTKDALVRALADRTLVITADLGGLSEAGLLDAKVATPPPTLDGAETWLESTENDGPVVPIRARLLAANVEPVDDGWSEVARFPWQAQADQDPTTFLVVETHGTAVTNEEGRSSGPPQQLSEHASWTEQAAKDLVVRLSLPEDLARVVVMAARLHDEGKRAERWQRAFSAPADGPYAKTRGPISLKLLDGYRHELGSLPYAEQDPSFQQLPDHDRDLVLHLIAAHHGGARPTISTSGCDDLPPSMIVERARAVALRYVALQERFGPWRLAWLESIVRAADQAASRRNKEVK